MSLAGYHLQLQLFLQQSAKSKIQLNCDSQLVCTSNIFKQAESRWKGDQTSIQNSQFRLCS